MAQLFPQWTNRLPLILLVGTILLGAGVYGFFAYYGSPWYTDVGYRPVQPVEFSHKVHAGDMRVDCRYCHNFVEVSHEANIPPTQTCMNCHVMIKADSEKMIPVNESWNNDTPIQWIRVHKLPDYAYFDHSVHLASGIGCVSCHGNIATMEVVAQNQPLSMSWCLDCHRNPDPYLRPVSEITNMTWVAPENHSEFVAQFKKDKNIAPPEDCSACHQ
ncbi:MAG: cytochrome C [Calditrichaeota bacterium]|nr:MAG: cytochrome C [Calditrichota bacterium]